MPFCRLRRMIYWRCLFVLVLLFVVSLAKAETSFLSESWDSYSNQATPYGGWELDRGGWADISDKGRNGSKCYFIAANVKSRLRHEIDLTGCTDIVLQGWLYDSGGSVNCSILGLNDNAVGAGNALIRIGTGARDQANYTIIFVDRLQSKLPITVDTGSPMEKGWHFLRLDICHDHTVTYHVWNADQTMEKAGHFVWVFDKAKLKYVVVGALNPTLNAVAWDDIKAGSLEQVGPPPQFKLSLPVAAKPKDESTNSEQKPVPKNTP